MQAITLLGLFEKLVDFNQNPATTQKVIDWSGGQNAFMANYHLFANNFLARELDSSVKQAVLQSNFNIRADTDTLIDAVWVDIDNVMTSFDAFMMEIGNDFNVTGDF